MIYKTTPFTESTDVAAVLADAASDVLLPKIIYTDNTYVVLNNAAEQTAYTPTAAETRIVYPSQDLGLEFGGDYGVAIFLSRKSNYVFNQPLPAPTLTVTEATGVPTLTWDSAYMEPTKIYRTAIYDITANIAATSFPFTATQQGAHVVQFDITESGGTIAADVELTVNGTPVYTESGVDESTVSVSQVVYLEVGDVVDTNTAAGDGTVTINNVSITNGTAPSEYSLIAEVDGYTTSGGTSTYVDTGVTLISGNAIDYFVVNSNGTSTIETVSVA